MNTLPNAEYRRAEEVTAVQLRRPVWPCRETINGVIYDKQTAQFVCKCGDDQEIYRTNDGNFFITSNGATIRPCPKLFVVESLLAYHLSPDHFADFREFMPSVFAVAA